eukprot:gb/GEZN01010119.1/.p1 GENE.gb/GEZN01010119.1/~~gb/GEZN01010119.1/.p1  ORF type:complete len:329 (+),score=48.91 gb/GEZN01010119.1/:83-1069(+)
MAARCERIPPMSTPLLANASCSLIDAVRNARVNRALNHSAKLKNSISSATHSRHKSSFDITTMSSLSWCFNFVATAVRKKNSFWASIICCLRDSKPSDKRTGSKLALFPPPFRFSLCSCSSACSSFFSSPTAAVFASARTDVTVPTTAVAASAAARNNVPSVPRSIPSFLTHTALGSSRVRQAHLKPKSKITNKSTKSSTSSSLTSSSRNCNAKVKTKTPSNGVSPSSRSSSLPSFRHSSQPSSRNSSRPSSRNSSRSSPEKPLISTSSSPSSRRNSHSSISFLPSPSSRRSSHSTISFSPVMRHTIKTEGQPSLVADPKTVPDAKAR